MANYAPIFAVIFLLLVVLFAVGITWVSLKGEQHSPGLHRSDEDAEHTR